MDSLNQIVHLNVGGQRFSTTKATLTANEESFFTSLLSGRISSLKDETGAYFIDRDPKLFSVLLTYLRTKELDLHEIDLLILRKEAEFYGLSSLSQKLALCMDGSVGVCGDLHFHGLVPYPEMNFEDGDAFGSEPRCIPNQKVTLIRCYYHFLAAVYSDRVALFKVKELTGWRLIWQSAPMPPQQLQRLALRSMKVSLHPAPAANAPLVPVSTNASTSTNTPVTTAANTTASPATTSSHSRERHTSMQLTSPSTTSTSATGVGVIPVPATGSSSSASQNMCYLAVSADDKITLWLINASYNSAAPSSSHSNTALPQRLIYATSHFNLNGHHVDELFFVSDKLVALSKTGSMAVWRMTSNSWQISNLEPVGSYCATTQALFLGMESGRIAYIDMDKFPVRLADNDLLVNNLYQDPDGEPISALSVYITSKNPLMDYQRVEIAYGTPSGYTRLVAQLPNESGYGYSFYLIQTLDVHRAPVRHVSLTSRTLISICEEHNHVRTWQVNRFRGMMSGQPGAQPLASYAMPSLACIALEGLPGGLRDVYQQGNSLGPWGDQRDEPHVLLHKMLPECEQVAVRCAATGEKIFTLGSANHSPISCFWVHEFNSDMRVSSVSRRIIFTGHCDGSVQMWDLSTAIDRAYRVCGVALHAPPASATSTSAAGGSVATGAVSATSASGIAHPSAVAAGELPSGFVGGVGSTSSGEVLSYGEIRDMMRMLEGWNVRASRCTSLASLQSPSHSLNSSRNSTLQRRQLQPPRNNSRHCPPQQDREGSPGETPDSRSGCL